MPMQRNSRLPEGSADGESVEDTIIVTIEAGFWKRLQDVTFQAVLPYQWRALNDEIPDAPPSHSIENLRIAAGLSSGVYDGMVFQDSDVAKWLEAAGHALRCARNDETFPQTLRETLEAWVDEAVRVVARAQAPDGYLNTYFTVAKPGRRWTNLRDAHELYCAGHMIEAAVAVFRGTGDRRLLDVAIRLADHIGSVFGEEDGKKPGYPGHQEIELALVKLASVTGAWKYLDLARYFLEERGARPCYFDLERQSKEYTVIWDDAETNPAYHQAHLPVRQQRDAVGHAVRAMYQCVAMADVALVTREPELVTACHALWESVVDRRMYVTGGIGSTRHGEAFTTDYDLPNDTAYAETCASIGLFMFADRMARLDQDTRYADAAERALYNGILSGLSISGDRYFYVNPLEVVPSECDVKPSLAHVKYRRQNWYGCACCPPNIARLLASLGDYFVRAEASTVTIDHYFSGCINAELAGQRMEIELATRYPWEGEVHVLVREAPTDSVGLVIRLPGWCEDADVLLNGESIATRSAADHGYIELRRVWVAGDEITLVIPMTVQVIRAHPAVRADSGLVAVRRGPIVYCLEEQDNGPDLHLVSLAEPSAFSLDCDSELGGVTVITADGYRQSADAETLYCHDKRQLAGQACKLILIPYYAWANREPGEMRVWIAGGSC
jgi:DUF1680 family protein